MSLPAVALPTPAVFDGPIGADVMWLIVLLSSVSSPIMVMLTLRFLRGGDPPASGRKGDDSAPASP